jgi:hypothetical protein
LLLILVVEGQLSSVTLATAPSELDFSSKLKYSSPINAVALYVPTDTASPPLIITGSDDDKAVVWDLRSGKKLRSLKGEHSDCIRAIFVYVPPTDPTAAVKVLTASDDNSIIVWDLSTGDKELTVTDVSAGGINAVAVGHAAGPKSSAWILGGCTSGTIQAWDLKSGDLLRSFVEFHSQAITCMTVFNNIVITGACDGETVIWNLQGKRLTTLEHDEGVTSVALYVPEEGDDHFSQPLLVTGHDDHTAVVWGFNTGEKVLVLEDQHEDAVSGVAIVSPLDKSLPIVVTCSHDSTAVLWDLLTGRVLRRLEGGHNDYVNAVAVYVPEDDKQPTRVVTAGDDCTVMVWELSKGILSTS